MLTCCCQLTVDISDGSICWQRKHNPSFGTLPLEWDICREVQWFVLATYILPLPVIYLYAHFMWWPIVLMTIDEGNMEFRSNSIILFQFRVFNSYSCDWCHSKSAGRNRLKVGCLWGLERCEPDPELVLCHIMSGTWGEFTIKFSSGCMWVGLMWNGEHVGRLNWREKATAHYCFIDNQKNWMLFVPPVQIAVWRKRQSFQIFLQLV